MRFSIRTMMFFVSVFALAFMCWQNVDVPTRQVSHVEIRNGTWNIVGEARNSIAVVRIHERIENTIGRAKVEFSMGAEKRVRDITLPVSIYGGQGLFSFDVVNYGNFSDFRVELYDKETGYLTKVINIDSSLVSETGEENGSEKRLKETTPQVG